MILVAIVLIILATQKGCVRRGAARSLPGMVLEVHFFTALEEGCCCCCC